jgi:uncharacterized membrane protein
MTIAFLDYTVGDDYTDQLTLAFAESIGFVLAWWLKKKLKSTKKVIVLGLVSSGVWTMLLLSIHSAPQTK